MHYVAELATWLQTVSSTDADEVSGPEDSVSNCPDLVWTLRDFFLDLEVNGHPITADEYLENSLRPKPGTDKSLQNFNLPRQCIQKFFPTKKCFIFDSPTHRKKLAQLETLHDDDLEPDFVQQVAEFCSYIFSHSKSKTLPEGSKANGSREYLLRDSPAVQTRGWGLCCNFLLALPTMQMHRQPLPRKHMYHMYPIPVSTKNISRLFSSCLQSTIKEGDNLRKRSS